jgi:hypothetical protein
MKTSHRTLNILAASVWYIGGIILIIKGSSLLFAGYRIYSVPLWTLMAGIAGLVIGSLKARFIFRRSCRKNLTRIAAIRQPRLWQFYRPQFFLLLTLMIILGATLSRLAHGNYGMLIAVAILDYSIGFALLGSSSVYWKQKAFAIDR